MAGGPAYVLAGQPEASIDVYMTHAFFLPHDVGGPLGRYFRRWILCEADPASTALFAFAVWLPAVIVAVQFHVAIGGSL